MPRKSFASTVTLALLVATCGGKEEAADTTPRQAVTSTLPVQAVSTSEPAPTSTTAVVAQATVVVGSEGVLGWWDGSNWVRPTADNPVPAQGGEQYQVVLLDEPISTATGSEPGPGCEFIDYAVSIEAGIPQPDTWPTPVAIAVSADWEVRPHLVEVLHSPSDVYVQIASELLVGLGIDDSEPALIQVIRTDLEGDGVLEVLVIAERQANDSLNPAFPGDYSIAFLRRIVDGEVQTAILGVSEVASLEAPDQIVALDVFRFAAVADLNGDQKMEIVLDLQYYEGGSVEVWEYVNDDLGPVLVLSVGCGV